MLPKRYVPVSYVNGPYARQSSSNAWLKNS